MEKYVLSIQINDIITKICLLEKQKDTIEVINSIRFETPENAYLDGGVLQIDELANAISQQISINNLNKTQNVIFVLSSSKIVSRKVTLPPVKQKQIKDIINSNAEDYFPIDLSNYAITYTVIDKKPEKNTGHSVIVTAVPKQLLLSYTNLANTAKLNVQSFNFEMNTQYRLFEKLSVKGTTMYVSIGMLQSLATFMKGSEMLLQRAIPFGISEILNEVMLYSNMGKDKILQVINMSSNEKWMNENITKQQFENSVKRLVSVITKSADFFKTSFKHADIERVILIDDGAQIAGIKNEVAKALKIKVYLLSEVVGVEKTISSDSLTYFATCCASLLGNNNFTYGNNGLAKQKKPKNSVIQKHFSKIFFACSIVIGVLITASSLIPLYNKNQQLLVANQKLEEMEYVQNIYDLYLENENIKTNIETIESIALNNNANLKAFFEEIEQKMPTNLSLLSAVCDNFGVTINVQTTTMQEAAKVLEQLRNFDSIVEISTSSITQAENSNGVNTVSFSVVCAYATAQYNTSIQQNETTEQNETIKSTDDIP